MLNQHSLSKFFLLIYLGISFDFKDIIVVRYGRELKTSCVTISKSLSVSIYR